MEAHFKKGETLDRVEVRRRDGTSAAFTFPKKGPTLHDAVHFYVERELGMRHGFWGLVAAGMDPGEVGALAAAGGHASATRARVPDEGIVELVQAERLVECFEAESWSGDADNDGIRAMAVPGWEASHVPPLVIADAALDAIRVRLAEFHAQWAGCAVGDTLTLEWEE